ncbi:hypothetical protein GIY11_01495 [Aerococcaceae bacterium DSM 109653]|uniref:DUF1351 domain-containing protein n=1 Tax=Fundicoccus ignavus TaxID=2664442 RepID=A0A844BW96_9LACT|nr:hypothetical protein [Fundicoccus ignavus]MRI80707.1 hypothetical protein [Fundicoccus ignavus]
MELEKLMNRVIKHVEESMQNIEIYNNALSDINMKEQSQDITPKRAGEMRAELQAKIAEKRDTATQSIVEMMNQVRESELKRIEGNRQTVTQEVMNELSLLSQIDVDHDELLEYAEKHSNSPLVLRRIADIAKQKEIPFALPDSQEVKLEKILDRINGNVDYIAKQINGGDLKLARGKLAFLNDGVAESYDSMLTDYSGSSNLLKNHTTIQEAKKLSESNNNEVPVNENNIPDADAVVAKMRLAFAESKLENGEWD